MASISGILIGAVLLLWAAVAIRSALHHVRSQPSALALAVASSLRSNPHDWDYRGGRYWLYSDIADIALHVGEVDIEIETTKPINRGLREIARLTGKSKGAVKAAHADWKRATTAHYERAAAGLADEATTLLCRAALKAA